MKFDTRSMEEGFRRMQKTAREKGKDVADDQANFFLRMTRKLGWKIAPTKDALDHVFTVLGGKLKRKKGVSPAQELARRKRMRGTFAKKWRILKVESAGYRIRIWIGNFVSYAGIVDDKRHIAEGAATIVGGAFKRKLDRLAAAAAKAFGN